MSNLSQMKKFNLRKIKEYIDQESITSKIYIGTDSTTRKKNGKWVADYYTVVVIHRNGCNGCKIFGEITTEEDFNTNRKKPTYRLMNECYKVSAAYLELIDIIGDRECEIHLDLNPNKKFVSSLVVEQAIGYIKGTCNIIPMVKPDAFAASYCADRLGRCGTMLKDATA
jgi:predicted RNase H-related nuclease YkuK (DUF458 family)